MGREKRKEEVEGEEEGEGGESKLHLLSLTSPGIAFHPLVTLYGNPDG